MADVLLVLAAVVGIPATLLLMAAVLAWTEDRLGPSVTTTDWDNE